MLEKLKPYLKFENAKFRRRLIGLFAASLVGLLVATPFVEELNPTVGLAVAAVLTFTLMGVLLDYVIELPRSMGIEVFRKDDDGALARQIDYVRTAEPSTVRLCEYSTGSIKPLLTALSKCEKLRSVQLLICDPKDAITTYQAMVRIIPAMNTLQGIFDLQTAQRTNLRIRCYGGRTSFRGRNYENKLIAVGWYTYDRRPNLRDSEQIWGDSNATVVARSSQEPGEALRDMFNRVFDNLWRNARTLSEALSPYAEKELYADNFPEEAWLQLVSRRDEPHTAERMDLEQPAPAGA